MPPFIAFGSDSSLPPPPFVRLPQRSLVPHPVLRKTPATTSGGVFDGVGQGVGFTIGIFAAGAAASYFLTKYHATKKQAKGGQ